GHQPLPPRACGSVNLGRPGLSSGNVRPSVAAREKPARWKRVALRVAKEDNRATRSDRRGVVLSRSTPQVASCEHVLSHLSARRQAVPSFLSVSLEHLWGSAFSGLE